MSDPTTPTPAPEVAVPVPAPALAAAALPPAPEVAEPAPAIPATPEPSSKMSMAKTIWGFGKDLLVIAIIPVVGWGVKLEVSNAQRDLHIVQLQVESVAMSTELKEVKDLVHQNSLALARMEGKIDTANGRLDAIKELILR